MDKEHVKGAADQAKGAIKDTAGKVIGDKELQTEGKIDKAKGAMHNAVGDAKTQSEKRASKRLIHPQKAAAPRGGSFFGSTSAGTGRRPTARFRLAVAHVFRRGVFC